MYESDTSVSSSLNFKTRLLHSGKAPAYTGGTAVNPPIVRASTVQVWTQRRN